MAIWHPPPSRSPERTVIDGEEYLFEFYPYNQEMTAAEQRDDLYGNGDWTSTSGMCQSRCSQTGAQDASGMWQCTLRAGHAGAHVGGLGHATCGMRWWLVDVMKDIDAGPDDGL